MITPETLVRHELVGLLATVTDATNPDLVGTKGRVVRESRNTLVLRPEAAAAAGNLGDSDARVRRVPKAGTTFLFRLDDDTSVEVAGARLVAPPARRTEMGGVSPWV